MQAWIIERRWRQNRAGNSSDSWLWSWSLSCWNYCFFLMTWNCWKKDFLQTWLSLSWKVQYLQFRFVTTRKKDVLEPNTWATYRRVWIAMCCWYSGVYQYFSFWNLSNSPILLYSCLPESLRLPLPCQRRYSQRIWCCWYSCCFLLARLIKKETLKQLVSLTLNI